MPNYCENSLTITANPETLDRIKSFVSGEERVFDFDRIVPMPAGVYTESVGPEEEKTYGNANWYDWCCKHWDTKWNSEDAEVFNDESSLVYKYLTAWSPSEAVIEELAWLFPDAKIFYRFSELGMCFCGEREFENGKCVYRMDGDITEHWFDDEDPDDVRCEPGVSYSEQDQGCGVYSFTYHDADEKREITIKGSCVDSRPNRPAFCW